MLAPDSESSSLAHSSPMHSIEAGSTEEEGDLGGAPLDEPWLYDQFPDLAYVVALETNDLPVETSGNFLEKTKRRAIAGKSARVEYFLSENGGSLSKIVSKISEARRPSVARDLCNHHLLTHAHHLGLCPSSAIQGAFYIIPYLGTRRDEDTIHHCMPYGESAFDFVHNNWWESANKYNSKNRGQLPKAKWSWEIQVAQWSAELIAGLQYIHELGFSHNDVKLENVLIYERRACWIDFDSMTPVGKKPSKKMMTRMYCSQECNTDSYCPQMNDVYALGVCIFIMLFAHQPEPKDFHDLTSGSYICGDDSRGKSLEHSIESFIGLARKRLVSEPAFDFLKRILRPESKRSNLRELAKHPWIVQNSSLSSESHKEAIPMYSSEEIISKEPKLPESLRRGVDLALQGGQENVYDLYVQISRNENSVFFSWLNNRYPDLARRLKIKFYYDQLEETYNKFCSVSPTKMPTLIE